MATAAAACGSEPATDDSSESEGETETSKAFHRRVSTSKAIKNGVCIKEGYLMKQTTSFQRWRRRFFKLKPRKLYYAKDDKSVIFEEVDLTDLSLAECSPKNINHSFQVITPFRRLILCAETRKEMEEWMSALKNVGNKDFYEGSEQPDFLSGQHNWYVASHARPTYCNVCREALSGVTSHGLSCEVCKFKAHKRCAAKAPNNCKWTTLSSVGKYIMEHEDGTLTMPHQWLEGNLPVSARCAVCDKTCGSVLRLQDWRCLWCRAMVHTSCKPQYPERCPLGVCRVSVVPPTALHSIGNDESWEANRPVGCSPLLVFCNSKSGDNQGVKFLRRFKQLLNPAQVFDLMNGGPSLGIRMFKSFNPFRILVCGGDGSVSWVLTEIDKLDLHNQCQIGVLPLGTGNDLARVLGWGSVCDDDTQLPQLLEKYERATTKLLDRWSIMTYEGTLPIIRKISAQYDPISVYEDSVVAHLTKILQSDQHSVVISSAKVLCETVKDFIAKVGAAYAEEGPDEEEDSISHKCAVLNEKLDSLLKTLNEESLVAESDKQQQQMSPEESEMELELFPQEEEGEKRDTEKLVPRQHASRSRRKKSTFIQREALMSRANSLKKAVRQIIKHTEKAVDEQNAQTKEREAASGSFSEGSESEKGPDPGGERPKIVIHTEERQEQDPTAFKPVVEPPPSSPALQSSWNPWGQPMGQSVGAALKHTLQVTLPTIEGGLSADSSPCPSPRPFMQLSSSTPSPLYSPCPSPLPVSPLPTSELGSPTQEMSPPQSFSLSHAPLVPSTDTDNFRTGSVSPCPPPLLITSKQRSQDSADVPHSPPASRRISSGSMLKRVGPLQLAPSSSNTEKVRSPETPTDKRDFPIINPLASLPMWPNLNKDSLIGKVLLANSDVLCAAASPLMNFEEISFDGFEEKCVMNNYFGIGLDAKITLEFHNKREEHPEKCRSRTKNLMWYGVLGGKELLQRTFKNLEQRVQLECDGTRIPLPSLQGIVVLNIPSYGGGSNFWGNTKEGEVFYVPAIDDKILEVVAVFGTVQMAASRVINLQHHRIAQCRSVKITILGEEGVPVQVDGEAWIQPPGYVCLVHKNRTQVLCRNRQLESSLKVWHEKQRTLNPSRSLPVLPLSEDELSHLNGFVEASAALVRSLKLMSMAHPLVEQELFHLVMQTSNCMDRLFPNQKVIESLNIRQQVSEFVSSVICRSANRFMQDELNIRQQVSDFVSSVKHLYRSANRFMQERIDETDMSSEEEERLLVLLENVAGEMKKCSESQGVVVFHGLEEEINFGHLVQWSINLQDQKKHRSLFKLKFKSKQSKTSKNDSQMRISQSDSMGESSSGGGGACMGGAGCGTPPPGEEVPVWEWGTPEVGHWLESICMAEYKENFSRHDIRGRELLDLERRDLRELGISKVGHIKRILQAIQEVSGQPRNQSKTHLG